MLPLLLPEVGEVVNHTALEETVQFTLEVRVMVTLPANGLTGLVVGVTVRFGAAWLTVTVRVRPPPLNVRIPVLVAAPVFPVKLAVTVPLLLPEVGVAVSQAALELTVQAMLEVSVIAKFPAIGETDWVAGDTVNTGGGAWVTVTVLETPPPVKVRIPVRASPVLAV